MDLEEVVDMNLNSTQQEYTPATDFYQDLFLGLFTAIGLLSAACNVLVVSVAFRFRKLRRDAANVILAHLCLTETVYLLATPLTLRVDTMAMLTEVQLDLLCVFYENEFVLVVGMCLFLALLVSEWYLKLYSEEQYARFRRVYKFFVAAIYVGLIFCTALTTQMCLSGSMSLISMFTMFVGYAAFVAGLIVVNVVHLVKRRRLSETRRHMGLFVANVFFFAWCPAVMTFVIVYVARTDAPVTFVITLCLGFSSPVVNFVYLFYYIDSYNVFLKRVLRCQCNDYSNEMLEEQAVSYNDVNGANC